MKQKNHILQLWLPLLLLSLQLLSSCSASEDLLEKEDGSKTKAPIEFSAQEDWNTLSTTRGASVSSFKQGDTIGVFAYYRPNESWDGAQEFMNNQKVTYNGKNWEYSPIKYWPSKGDIVFYAYAPYNSNVTSKEIKGFKWSIANDVKKQQDLVASAPLFIKVSEKPDVVEFGLSHILSRIKFKASSYVEGLNIKRILLISDSIKDVANWALNKEDKLEWTNFSSNSATTRTEYNFYQNETLATEFTANSENLMFIDDNGQQAAFLLPQNISRARLKVEYSTIEGGEKILETEIPSGTELAMGKSYTFSIDFNKGKSNNLNLPKGYSPLTYVESIGTYKPLKNLENHTYYVLDTSKPRSTPINLGIHTNGGTYGIKMVCESVKYEEENGEQKQTNVDTFPFGALTKSTSGSSPYANRFYGLGFVNNTWQCGWANKMFRSVDMGTGYDFFRKYEYSINYLNKKTIELKVYDKTGTTKETIGISGDFEHEPYTDSDMPVYLFGLYKAGITSEELWVGRIYDVWISKGELELMHLVPCRKGTKTDVNSSVGMYDLIGQEYYPLANGKGNDEEN